jgi:tRNA (cmo5U34)-methyltransferase
MATRSVSPDSAHSAVARAFSAGAPGYDASRRQLVPCFDDFYASVLARLPFADDAAPRVLDLGAGTGLLAALVAERWPRAELTLVDVSGDMLALARERFARRPGGATCLEADYAEAPLGGPYDAVVSALSIHHLAAPAKRALFARIRSALAAGGVLANADQVLGETPSLDRFQHETWLRQARALGADEPTLAQALARMEHDRPDTVRDQLDWLRAAGFVDVSCWYRSFRFAVFGGVVPA